MTDGQIKTTITSPLAQGPGTPNQVPRFAGDRSAAMAADDVRRHARIRRQLNRLRKVARSDLDLMPARDKLRNQRAKERHVRRVGQVDPNAHELFLICLDAGLVPPDRCWSRLKVQVQPS